MRHIEYKSDPWSTKTKAKEKGERGKYGERETFQKIVEIAEGSLHDQRSLMRMRRLPRWSYSRTKMPNYLQFCRSCGRFYRA
jgi:hypothetical protein